MGENVSKKQSQKKYKSSQSRQYWFRPAIAFVLVIIVLGTAYLVSVNQMIEDSKARGMAIAGSETSTIRDRFDVIFARDYALSNLIVASGGDIDSVQDVADNILEETEESSGISLKNIALAPDGVVERVYPLTGNEGLIGFDFMDETKEGNTEAIQAYEKGQLVVTNPFSHVQGGQGMGGRLPVFLGEGNDKEFWGLVTVTLDYDMLMKSLNLDSLTERGFYYHLWYRDAESEQVTLASSATMPEDYVTQTFHIANLTWNLDIAPINGWYSMTERVVVYIAILLFAILMAAIQFDKVRIQMANEQLERLAHTDALTSCYSRQYVNTMLVNQRTGRWHNQDLQYSLIMLDIDHFKQINDTYGHEVGDRVIVAAAQVLMDNCREFNGDCVVRHGGDEFIVLFNNVTRERFEMKMKKIVEDMRKLHFDDLPQVRVTVSVGGDYFISAEQSRYYDQIHRADAKLYLAKKQGRDQYCL